MKKKIFFDVHTHVQFAAFANDYCDAIRRALQAGVGMINVGTQKDTSRRAVEVAHEFEGEPVYATVGLHPIHTDKSYHDSQELGIPPAGSGDNESSSKGMGGFTSRGEEFDYAYYLALALDPKVVAIGECGLDYYRGKGKEEEKKQRQAFLQQIELAHEIKKPLMIHCRDAFGDLIEILKSNIINLKSNAPGVVHFFTGTKEDARALLDLGFSFTFGGAITFPAKKGTAEGTYDEIIRYLPLDRILTETDAPYVAPVPYRGKRNEPAYVVEVVKKIAELKGVSVEEVAHAARENARLTFCLSGSNSNE